MIQELIEELARDLVTTNASWLQEVRVIGYMHRISESGVNEQVVFDQHGKEIGITDRSGNSGYIRFLNDQGFSTERGPSFSSCKRSTTYTFRLRLVIAAKTETPENLALLLATQISAAEFSIYPGATNIYCTINSGGSNSGAIHRTESNKEQIQENYRIVYTDFNLVFTWLNDCNQIPITMACDNCTSTYDFGCIQHCLDLSTGITSTYTGTATVNTQFNGVIVTQSINVVTGEEIIIPMDSLNENYTYSIQLRDEEGAVIDFEKGSPSETYDCLKIEVKP